MKDIALLNAVYYDVPAVELPINGGGTATFTDVTDTTAIASDVAQGKYFYNANGVRTQGTGSGGGGADIPTFTVIWDDDYSSVISVTCDKTFAECDDSDYGVASVNENTQSGEDANIGSASITVSTGSYIDYAVYFSGVYPAYDIRYNSNGTISVIKPTQTYETLNVSANGTYYPQGGIITEVNVSVSGGGGTNNGSDVFFIDYDGSIVASYSKSNLVMPSNPSHTGLTSQGWNWTQQQITTQLTAYPNQPVYVGQMYITDDGKTRLYVHFEEERKSPYLGLGVNGTVTIDWGDNTTDTLTGTSLVSAKNVQHLYQTGGDYVIKLTPTSGSFSIFGVSSNGTNLLKKEASVQANTSRVYSNAVQKVELGSNVTIGTYAFYYCCSLTSITIPKSVTSFGTYAFYYCYSLKSITVPSDVTSISSSLVYCCYSLASIAIPSGVTSFGTNEFRNCYSLASITIPSGMTSIDNYAFYGCSAFASITVPSSVTSLGTYAFHSCYSLASITIPSGITSIGGNTFNGCYGMKEYHFLRTTPPSLSNTNAFSGIPSDCVIYVPYSADHSILNAYKTASNWSTYASKMQEEPQ